jgi:peptide-methionine (S)-S-oxide reductase
MRAASTPNPTYEEVCSGLTGHSEVVLVVYDQDKLSMKTLLKMFWELHDPTQGMRQGNDIGSQYRSVIYCTTPEQLALAQASAQAYQEELTKAGLKARSPLKLTRRPRCTSPRLITSSTWRRIPEGYCGIGGTGVTCPI